MFDLDQAIAEWRRQMLAAGIKSPVPLEELESHLRDHVEQQVRLGIDPQQAFNTAARQIGYANELKSEFKKTCGTGWNARSLWFPGIIGLAITVILNLVGLFVLHKGSSVFFSDKWWADWFPNYILWMSFIIVGFTNHRCQRRSAKQ
jgi:hypothetical protein